MTSEQTSLTEGEANSDNAEHYETEIDGETVHCKCFGCSVFVWAADDPSRDGRRENITGYDLWMLDRNGPGVERVAEEATVWSEVDQRRQEEGIADA
jgi:hypothetical protein